MLVSLNYACNIVNRHRYLSDDWRPYIECRVEYNCEAEWARCAFSFCQPFHRFVCLRLHQSIFPKAVLSSPLRLACRGIDSMMTLPMHHIQSPLTCGECGGYFSRSWSLGPGLTFVR